MGKMRAEANESAARLASREGKIAIAGSDSHTIAGVGQTYTEVQGRELWMNFSPDCGQAVDESTACMAAAANSRQTFSVLCGRSFGTSMDAGDVSVRGAGTCVYGETLVERNSFLPKWTAALEHGDRRKRMLWDLDSNLRPTGQVEVRGA